MQLFYLLVWLLPTNLAKHFVLPSSFVAGHLIDYLIPAVYLTDLFILALVLPRLSQLTAKLLRSPLAVFLLLLLPSVILVGTVPTLYKWLKLLEFSYLAIWIKENVTKKHLPTIAKTLSLAVLFQSTLAIGQWLKQGSVFGYWFLGEQPYTASTTGIDRITWINGALRIPPLGTTPHPNVLGGFLAVTLPLIFIKLQGKNLKWLRWITIILGLTALFLTFSLSAWLAFLLIGIPAILWDKLASQKPKIALVFIASGLFLIVMSLAFNFQFLAPPTSFSRRSQLAEMSLKMTADKPLTGVGLNNFTNVMDNYGQVQATTRFLQPVHNIFLLVLSESGFLGLIGFTYLLFKFRKVRPYGIGLAMILFLGLFDHYPLTLQTGMLLLFWLI